MATFEDDEIVDDEQLESLLSFPPEVQEAIDQVREGNDQNIYFDIYSIKLGAGRFVHKYFVIN